MANCQNNDIGLRPLNDLGTREYQPGWSGGLYPSGLNERPSDHTQSGILFASQVVTLDPSGIPSPIGAIGVLALGFSITNLIFNRLMTLVSTDQSVNPNIQLVNACEPAKSADEMANPNDEYWTTWVPNALASGSITNQQIEVIWLLTGRRYQVEPFPNHVYTLENNLVSILNIIKNTFPNVKLCFFGSIQYMGYSLDVNGGEPYIFEQSLAIKNIVERQITGDPAVSFDVAPWISWGPYLWCNGVIPRSDGLVWNCPQDVISDGDHPSNMGSDKLARIVLHMFKSDVTATPWFLTNNINGCNGPAFVDLVGSGTIGTAGEPMISVNELPIVPTPSSLMVNVVKAKPNASATFFLGYSLLPSGGLNFAGGTIYVNWSTIYRTHTDNNGKASFALGPIPNSKSYCGVTVYSQAIIADPNGPTGKYAHTQAILIRSGD